MGERAGIVHARCWRARRTRTVASLPRQLAGHQHHLRSTGLPPLQRAVSIDELRLAADEAREAARPGAL